MNIFQYIQSSPEIKELWTNLLTYLKQEPQDSDSIYHQSDIQSDSKTTFLNTIVDLDHTNFLNKIKQSMVDALTPEFNYFHRIDPKSLEYWDDYYWNESVATLLQQSFMGRHITDDEFYNLLIEKEDGRIDRNYLNYEIGSTAFEKYRGQDFTGMQIYGIRHADAANSFVVIEDLYQDYEWTKGWTIKIGQQSETPVNYQFMKKPIELIFYNDDFYNETDFKHDIEILIQNLRKGIYYDDLKEFFDTYSIPIPSQLQEDYYYKGGGETDSLILKRVINPWVIPWYNFEGETYRYKRGNDLKVDVMTDPEFLDFTHTKEGNYKATPRLIMPQNKRKVEIEDLNRNFWVIGQTLAAMSAYLLDDEGPFKGLIKGILNEIMQLWENVLYLWPQLSLITQKEEGTKLQIEICYLNPSDFQTQFKYDNFELDESLFEVDKTFTYTHGRSNYLEQTIDEAGSLTDETIGNSNLKTLLERRLAYLRKIYVGYSVAVLPIIRFNNYKHNYFSRYLLPGCLFFDCRDGGKTTYWQMWYKYENDVDRHAIGYAIDIDLRDYQDCVWSIYESEDSYKFCCPLSYANVYITENLSEIYMALVEDTFTNLSYTLDTAFRLNMDMKFTDKVEEIYNNYHGTNYQTTLLTFSTSPMAIGGYNISNRFTIQDSTTQTAAVPIEEGFYAGELLSYINAPKYIQYEILTIDTQLLPDNIYSDVDEYKRQYGNQRLSDNQKDSSILFDEEYDTYALQNFLRGVWTYYTLLQVGPVNLDSFLEIYQALIYNNSYNYLPYEVLSDTQQNWFGRNATVYDKVGYEQNGGIYTPIKLNRAEVEKDYVNHNLNWNNISEWEGDIYWTIRRWAKEIKKPETIIFVSGYRGLNAIPNTELSPDAAEGKTVVGVDGLPAHFYSKPLGPDNVYVGAAIRMPFQNNESETIYYPAYISPTSPQEENNSGFANSLRVVYRDYSCPVPQLYVYDINTDSYKIQNRNDDSYRDHPLMVVTPDLYIKEYYRQLSLLYMAKESQLLVMRNENDAELRRDNWRVCQINQASYYYTRYCDVKKENDQTIIKRTYLEGKEFKVGAIEKRDYYSALYKKYVKNYIDNWLTTHPNKSDRPDYFNKWVEDHPNETPYVDEILTLRYFLENLQLWRVFFGWFRFYDENNNLIQEARFSVDNPFLFSENQEEFNEQKLIFDTIDKKGWAALSSAQKTKVIENYLSGHYNPNISGDGWKSQYSKVICNLGILTRENSAYNIDRDWDNLTDDWAEDQIVAYHEINPWYTQWMALYENDTSWKTQVDKVFNRPELQTLYKKNPELFNFPLEVDWGQDRLCYTGSILHLMEVHVFGPKDLNNKPLYARRGIYRYSPDSDLFGTDAGKWPNAQSEGRYHTGNWTDETQFLNYTVDELRQGYEVIANTEPNRNMEKFKSHYSKDSYNGNPLLWTCSQGCSLNEDLDFSSYDAKVHWSSEVSQDWNEGYIKLGEV